MTNYQIIGAGFVLCGFLLGILSAHYAVNKERFVVAVLMGMAAYAASFVGLMLLGGLWS